MISLHLKAINLIIITAASSILMTPQSSPAQSNGGTAGDQSFRVSIAYMQPADPALQEILDILKERHALEQIQQMLSPVRWPEQLTIMSAECGVVNSWYRRELLKPVVTLCYEFLKHILQSLPTGTTPDGISPADAAVGQFLWVALHETGHATFDILDVPIFGSAEDAADNFATYILLHFNKNQARRLILGAASAWRAYLGDYKKNPVVPLRLSAFGSDHGLPQERYYNLLCMAVGAQPEVFRDLESYLPSTRTPHCASEYQRLAHAFHKVIDPHVDPEIARQVLDTNWLESLESNPASPK
jgi:hypothetical protein